MTNKDKYIEIVGGREGRLAGDRLRFQMRKLFKNIDFAGKRVLDIGGGSGSHSFYAGVMGASDVVCLEPELDGASEGMNRKFNQRRSELGLKNVQLIQQTFQEFDGAMDFDICVMHNACNHLNETACQRLHLDETARNEYIGYFKKLNEMMTDGGRIIVSDCTRHNFWASLPLKNPFAPTIEWHLHQGPNLWRNLLSQAGFEFESLSWSSFTRLGVAGSLFLGNRVASYFLNGHFNLYSRKPVRPN